MFLFLKLYLAHTIADFILQFEELYQLKLKSFVGHALHVLCHFVVSILLVFPYLDRIEVVLMAGLLSFIHLGQDIIKYKVQEKHPRVIFWAFTTDQVVHFLVIGLIFLFPISHEVRSFTLLGEGSLFYTTNFYTIFAIAWVWATFGAAYHIYGIRKTFFSIARPDHGISSFEIVYGIVERTIIMGFVLFAHHPLLWAITPLIGLMRFMNPKLRDRLDFILSFLYAITVGLLFRFWI